MELICCKPKKRIALCMEYPVSLRGGVIVVVETLVQRLTDRYEVVVVTGDSPETFALGSIASLVKQHLCWPSGEATPQLAMQLAKTIADTGVGLVHFNFGGNYGWGTRIPGRSPIPYLARLGVPVITSVHSVVSPLDGYCDPKRSRFYKMACLPMAWLGKMQVLRSLQQEFAVSRHDHALLSRWYWPLRNRFSYLYHSRLDPGNLPSAPVVREKLVLCVGHLAHRKGQLILAEAFVRIASQHLDWKLMLVGPPVEESVAIKIRDLAVRTGLVERFHLTGEQNDVFRLMQRAGIYVQPSLEEAFGLGLQEAMYAGCPCLGSRVGGIPELITGEQSGWLFEKGNVAELAEKLDRLIRSPETRIALGEKAAASIRERNMTVTGMTEAYAKIYARYLGEGKDQHD